VVTLSGEKEDRSAAADGALARRTPDSRLRALEADMKTRDDEPEMCASLLDLISWKVQASPKVSTPGPAADLRSPTRCDHRLAFRQPQWADALGSHRWVGLPHVEVRIREALAGGGTTQRNRNQSVPLKCGPQFK